MMMKDVGLRINNKVRELSKQQLQEMNRVLSQPSFAEINRTSTTIAKEQSTIPRGTSPSANRNTFSNPSIDLIASGVSVGVEGRRP